MLHRLFAQLFKPKPAAAPPGADLASALKLHHAGHHAQAEAVCRELLARSPEHADTRHILGITLLAQEKAQEAVAVLTRVAALDGAPAEAHYHLAMACSAAGDLERAVDAFRQTLALAPGFAQAHYNLAIVLVSLQRYAEAIERYRTALACEPQFLLARSNLLFLLNAHSTDPAEILREHRAWGERHAPAPEDGPPHYANTRDPERRLRIAYVSPDFWSHPVARFIEPMLRHHDRSAVEVWCYYAHTAEDAVTARLRPLADRWIDCADLDDAALAARLREDRIDVAVDLAGHTARNRLLAVARSPAPVTATYLGYPTTTGIAAIAYRITDAVVDPPGEDSRSVETVLRLPHSYYCYAELEETRDVGPLPAKRNRHVTFGTFNACTKWSDESLRLWAKVLASVGGSTLLLKAKDLGQPAIARRVLERFAELGVDTARIDLQAWAPTRSAHFSIYDRVDIAVDTYPYNGATTTCEALWMGVPVVTLAGPTHASRMGASLLTAAGCGDWIASSPDEYAHLCAGLAADLEALQAIRASLRARVRASPLMDAPRFAADLERAYRDAWRAWAA